MFGNVSKLRARSCGDQYEAFARRYLEREGLTFVAANVACRTGEIDLIMRDQQTWVFVEVRYRRNANFGGAAESVTRNASKTAAFTSRCIFLACRTSRKL